MTTELQPAKAGLSARWQAGHLVALAGVLLVGLGLGWHERLPEVEIGGDEATYVALSHSLEQGHYRDEFLSGTPPHAKYPPGNAVWLLLLRDIGGPDLDLVRFANLLLLAITALLTGDAVRRLASPWAGVGATAVIILSPGLLRVSGSVLSETPYIALVTLSAWACLRGDRAADRRWEILGYAAALAAFLTRSIGFTALVAITLMYLVRRRWRAGALAGIGTVVAGAGWGAYIGWASQRTNGETYGRELITHLGRISLLTPTFVATALKKSYWYFKDLPANFVLPTVEGTPVDNIAWYLILFGCGGAGLWVLVRRWPVLVLTLTGSFLVLATWVWGVERLILPLLPGGVALLMVGAHTLGYRRNPQAAVLAVSSLAVLLSTSALVWHRSELFNRPDCDRRSPYGPFPCFGAKATRLVAAARFANQALPADAIVATSKPATVYHFGGRRAFPLGALVSGIEQDSARPLASFGFTHIILGEVLANDWRIVAPLLYRRCRSLRVVADFPPATVLLSLGEADPSEEGACRYLEGRLRDRDVPGDRPNLRKVEIRP